MLRMFSGMLANAYTIFSGDDDVVVIVVAHVLLSVQSFDTATHAVVHFSSFKYPKNAEYHCITIWFWWCFYCMHTQTYIYIDGKSTLGAATAAALLSVSSEREEDDLNSIFLLLSHLFLSSSLFFTLPFTLCHLSTHFKYWWLFFCYTRLCPHLECKWNERSCSPFCRHLHHHHTAQHIPFRERLY